MLMSSANDSIAGLSSGRSEEQGFPARLRAARKEKFGTQAKLAEAIGLHASYVSRWENGVDRPEKANIERLAAALNVTPAFLEYGAQMTGGMFGEGLIPATKPTPLSAHLSQGQRASATQSAEASMSSRGRANAVNTQQAYRASPSARTFVKDFPLFAAAEGGHEGAIVLDAAPIDWIERPPGTVGADAFAISVVGESMEPRIQYGDVVYVDRATPRPGNLAVFVSENEETGERHALIKELLRPTRSHWLVRQLNPEKQFELDRVTWRTVFRVIGISFID